MVNAFEIPSKEIKVVEIQTWIKSMEKLSRFLLKCSSMSNTLKIEKKKENNR